MSDKIFLIKPSKKNQNLKSYIIWADNEDLAREFIQNLPTPSKIGQDPVKLPPLGYEPYKDKSLTRCSPFPLKNWEKVKRHNAIHLSNKKCRSTPRKCRHCLILLSKDTPYEYLACSG